MTTKLTTERAVFEALCGRFEPPAYAVLPGVPNGTGSKKTRTIDALVMSLWPSRGLTLAGVEIKVSRSDLKRELDNPEKAEPFFKYLDHFWLAVGDESIVQAGDVPETWGLLVPARTKMRVAKEAPRLPNPEPMPRAFLAAILRRAHEQATAPERRAEIAAEVEAKLGEELANLREEVKHFRRGSGMIQDVALMSRFCERSGVYFATWNGEALDQAADIVKALTARGGNRLLASARCEAEGAKRMAETLNTGADEMLAEIDRLEALTAVALAEAPAPPQDPAQPIDPDPATIAK